MKQYIDNGHLVEMSLEMASVNPSAEAVPDDALVYQLSEGAYGFSAEHVLPAGASDVKGKPNRNAVPDSAGGWIDVEDVNSSLPVLPVLISHTDPHIETSELVNVSVDFLVPGSDPAEKQVLTHFAPDTPVTQTFHAPFVDSNDQLAFNQGFSVNEGHAEFGMRFPNPVLYFLKAEQINAMLEKRELPFRVELYSQLAGQDVQEGDVEFIVFQAPEASA